MKKLILGFTFLISISIFSNNVFAWDIDQTRTVLQLGSHVENTGFVNFHEGVDSNCMNGVLYFDISKPLGKTMFATLNIAKIAKNGRVRITYTKPTKSSQMCYLELASLFD